MSKSQLVPMSLGELFGPVSCEKNSCKRLAWTIWMTRTEYRDAKEQREIRPINYVFHNKIGIAMCDECSEWDKKSFADIYYL